MYFVPTLSLLVFALASKCRLHGIEVAKVVCSNRTKINLRSSRTTRDEHETVNAVVYIYTLIICTRQPEIKKNQCMPLLFCQGKRLCFTPNSSCSFKYFRIILSFNIDLVFGMWICHHKTCVACNYNYNA